MDNSLVAFWPVSPLCFSKVSNMLAKTVKHDQVTICVFEQNLYLQKITAENVQTFTHHSTTKTGFLQKISQQRKLCMRLSKVKLAFIASYTQLASATQANTQHACFSDCHVGGVFRSLFT